MFLVVRPEENGNGHWCHHAHPDRTVVEALAGDVLIHKRRQYRVLVVQRFNDWQKPWFHSVQECVTARA